MYTTCISYVVPCERKKQALVTVSGNLYFSFLQQPLTITRYASSIDTVVKTVFHTKQLPLIQNCIYRELQEISCGEVETAHCPEHTESFCSHSECGHKNKHPHAVSFLPLGARCTCAHRDLMTSANTINLKWFVVSSKT